MIRFLRTTPELPRGRGLNKCGNGCADASLMRTELDKRELILFNLFIEIKVRNMYVVQYLNYSAELQEEYVAPLPFGRITETGLNRHFKMNACSNQRSCLRLLSIKLIKESYYEGSFVVPRFSYQRLEELHAFIHVGCRFRPFRGHLQSSIQ